MDIAELTDTEQSIVETMGDTVVGEVILKLIGPELDEVFSEPEDETEQMLASEESPNYRDETRDRFGDREPMDEAIEPRMRESFRMGKEPREIDFNRDRPSEMPNRNKMHQDLDREPPMLMDDPQRNREMASR